MAYKIKIEKVEKKQELDENGEVVQPTPEQKKEKTKKFFASVGKTVAAMGAGALAMLGAAAVFGRKSSDSAEEGCDTDVDTCDEGFDSSEEPTE